MTAKLISLMRAIGAATYMLAGPGTRP